MRPAVLAIPTGLAFACAGMALMRAANAPHVGVSQPLKEAAVRHFVTPEMERDTAKEARTVAPAFTVPDYEGKKVTIGSPDAARPQFVYFILDGCPCSYDAEPLFHKLSQRFKGQIDFVSVTDAKPAKAREWAVAVLPKYPVVPDPEKEIIHAYKAKASVYSALVSRDGHIIRMWPGYSAGLLKDMNAEMAKAAGVPEKPFDPEYAPLTKAAGCAF